MPLFGSSSSSSGGTQQAATPAPPSLPRAARPSASGSSSSGGGSSESHATFLFAQVRQTLQQLHRRGNVLARDYSELLRVLDKCEFQDEQSGERGAEELMHVPEGQLSKEELGKRNAWMRETLAESDLLPAIVQAALNVTAGPFMTSLQQDAIMSLVERSQKKIAFLLTNPAYQSKAKSATVNSARAVGKGVSTGFSSAVDGSSELLAKQRAASRAKREAAREKKALRAELKREREQIALMRREAAQPAASSQEQRERDTAWDKRDAELSRQQLALGDEADDDDDDEGEDSEGEDESAPGHATRAMSSGHYVASPSASLAQIPSRNLPPPPPGTRGSSGLAGLHKDDYDASHGALASVQCLDPSSLSTSTSEELSAGHSVSSAATTTFSPWPGLLLTSTLVVASGSPRDIAVRAEAAAKARGERTEEEHAYSAPSTAGSSRRESGVSSAGFVSSPTSAISLAARPPLPPPPMTAASSTPSEPQRQQTTPVPPAAKTPYDGTAAQGSRSVPPPAQPPPQPVHDRAPAPSQAHPQSPAPVSSRSVPPPSASPAASRALPPAPATQPDPTAPPAFGTVVDTTEQKKKGSGFGKLLGK